MTALCSLVKGACRAEDLSHLAFAHHSLLSVIDSVSWFEWVQSESNVADGGSRFGVCDRTSASLGIQLEICL